MQKLEQLKPPYTLGEYKEWFYSKVNKTDDCWLWTPYGRSAGGYGICNWHGLKYPTSPHKVAWLLEYGDVPSNHVVKHLCRNKTCVNPDHLFLAKPGGIPFTLEERIAMFWTRVNKTDTCWVWNGTIGGPFGYGVIRSRGRNTVAHRFSWEIHFGKVPEGILVCHHCDNPPCVRPDHLFLGTPLTNAQDRDAKGRLKLNIQRGESNGLAKLTNTEVLEMRRLHRAGLKRSEIAASFGRPVKHVNQIVYGYTWRHLL